MRKSPLVVLGTFAGLFGVLGFHSTPAKISLGSLSVAGTTPTSIQPTTTTSSVTSASTTSSAPPPSSTTTTTIKSAKSSGSTTTTSRSTATSSTTTTTSRPVTTTTSTPVTTTTTAPTTTTTASSSARSATGELVNYHFGILSVTVDLTGTKITKVTIGSLNDGGNPRSQSIDQQAIPLLEQQVLTAQSANIQGVSGASYTSAGFVMSLQNALKQLGL